MGLWDLFSSDNERAAADAKIAGLNAGYSQLSDLYGQGRNALNQTYGAGINAAQGSFQPFAQAGTAGYNAYADATGANGAEGLGRARSLFQQTPGFQSGFDMGLNALDRRAASRGMLGSGNNSLDTIRFANDYANQKYNQYVAGLEPFKYAPTQANQNAAVTGGLYSGLGNNLNTSFQGQGQSAYNTQTGAGNANAAYELSKDQTGLNILNGLFGGASLLSKGFGGGLFNGLFGGGSPTGYGA